MAAPANPRRPAREDATREALPEVLLEGVDPAPEEVMLGAREEPDCDPDWLWDEAEEETARVAVFCKKMQD